MAPSPRNRRRRSGCYTAAPATWRSARLAFYESQPRGPAVPCAPPPVIVNEKCQSGIWAMYGQIVTS